MKRGHILCDAEFVGRGIKCVQRLAQFGQQVCLAGELIAMGVVAADRAEEDLASHAEISPRGNELGDHVKLIWLARSWGKPFGAAGTPARAEVSSSFAAMERETVSE